MSKKHNIPGLPEEVNLELEVNERTYEDENGDTVKEYTHRGMRLRMIVKDDQKLFNMQDIETLKGYTAEEAFSFLFAAMGDELFNYLAVGGNA